MSEKNNIFDNDLLMRAILEGGQEEVPGRVWDAVSDRLDKIESSKRRTAALWWRRAGISVAAIAAAVASVLMLRHTEQSDIVPQATQTDMIAVVEPETVIMETEEATPVKQNAVTAKKDISQLVAYAPEAETITEDIMPGMPVAVQEKTDTKKVEQDDIQVAEKTIIAETPQEKEYFPVVWEDEVKTRKVKTSFTLSGITGAGSGHNGGNNGILKAPSVILPVTETGIKENNGRSDYGIPLSFGAGVKFELTPRWSIGVGLNYTYLTRKFTGTYTHVDGSGNIDELITSEIRNNQHYIGIPLNAYFNIINSRKVNFYTYAGGTVERCVADKYQILSKPITHTEKAKGVQLSANIGLGAEFMLGKHLGIYLDPSLRYYFDCKQPRSIRTTQPLMFGLEMGLRFRL